MVGLRAMQEQVFAIRDDFAKGFNARDAGMAYAFHARRALRAPEAKTALWAADIHVAQNVLPNGERPLGQVVQELAGRIGRPAEELAPAVARIVRQLMLEGYLAPAVTSP